MSWIDKYPRIGKIKKTPNPGRKCDKCGGKGTHKGEVEWTFLRGDDETFVLCDEHGELARNDAKLVFGKYEEVKS
jgi:hypothetical protein